MEAVRKGDAKAVMECSAKLKFASDPAVLIEVYAHHCVAEHHFFHAAVTKFGESGNNVLPSSFRVRHSDRMLDRWIKAVQNGQVKKDGDKAQLSINLNEPVTLHFRKEGRDWKLLYLDLGKDEIEGSRVPVGVVFALVLAEKQLPGGYGPRH